MMCKNYASVLFDWIVPALAGIHDSQEKSEGQGRRKDK